MSEIIHVPPQLPRSSPCRIAFVGEAPSTEELEKGKPLVGPAGRIFNALLRTADLDREEYYVGNVFDHKIPKNSLPDSGWCVGRQEAEAGGYYDPQFVIPYIGVLRPEFRGNLDRLARSLNSVKPHVIVPLGSTALWAFTGDTDVGTFRGGTSLAQRVCPGTKILPTFHPAHVMRQWKMFSVVVGDFIKAAAQGEYPEYRPPQKDLWIEPTFEEAMFWLEDVCMKSDLLSVDIETGWGQITCIGFAPNPREAMCIPFVDLRRADKSYWDGPHELMVWQAVQKLLESDVPKLGQNFAAYDAYWLLDKYGIRVMNLREDTRLLHHALYPELPKSLAFMAGSYTEQGPWKHMGASYGKFREKKRDD